MTNVTCELAAKKPGSALSPTLVIEYGTTLLYFNQGLMTHNYRRRCTEHFVNIPFTYNFTTTVDLITLVTK